MPAIRQDFEELPPERRIDAPPDMDQELSAIIFAVMLLAIAGLGVRFGLPFSRDADAVSAVRTADAALPAAADFNTFFARRTQLR